MLAYVSQSLKHYLLALQFFTRVPVTGRLAAWVGFSPAMLRASAAHFPGVGWLVGLVVASFTAVLLVALRGLRRTSDTSLQVMCIPSSPAI